MAIKNMPQFEENNNDNIQARLPEIFKQAILGNGSMTESELDDAMANTDEKGRDILKRALECYEKLNAPDNTSNDFCDMIELMDEMVNYVKDTGGNPDEFMKDVQTASMNNLGQAVGIDIPIIIKGAKDTSTTSKDIDPEALKQFVQISLINKLLEGVEYDGDEEDDDLDDDYESNTVDEFDLDDFSHAITEVLSKNTNDMCNIKPFSIEFIPFTTEEFYDKFNIDNTQARMRIKDVSMLKGLIPDDVLSKFDTWTTDIMFNKNKNIIATCRLLADTDEETSMVPLYFGLYKNSNNVWTSIIPDYKELNVSKPMSCEEFLKETYEEIIKAKNLQDNSHTVEAWEGFKCENISEIMGLFSSNRLFLPENRASEVMKTFFIENDNSLSCGLKFSDILEDFKLDVKYDKETSTNVTNPTFIDNFQLKIGSATIKDTPEAKELFSDYDVKVPDDRKIDVYFDCRSIGRTYIDEYFRRVLSSDNYCENDYALFDKLMMDLHAGENTYIVVSPFKCRD